MGNRVDPCTGIIVSGPYRPTKFPPSKNGRRSPKSGNMYLAKPRQVGEPQDSISLQPVPQLTLAQLKEFAEEIGKAIAAKMQPVVIHGPPAQSTGPYVSPEFVRNTFVDIDESIIDVGIGKQEPLEKGQGSAKIAQEATKQDNLSSAKQALKAMKVK